MQLKTIALTAAVVAGLAATASAGTISSYGTYELHNHANGGIRSPFYGLRLDGLDGDVNKEFTFDFDDTGNGSAMYLTYFDDNGVDSIRIHGTAWGGEDVGSVYATTGPTAARLWDIDFTYRGVTTATGDDDLWVSSATAASTPSTGTIAPTLGGAVTQLLAVSGSHPFSFRLGDEDDDSGHRMNGGISGWGWVNHQTPGAGTSLGTHLYASDFLFTVGVQVVPLPPTAWMGLGLLSILGAVRLRRRRKALSS